MFENSFLFLKIFGQAFGLLIVCFGNALNYSKVIKYGVIFVKIVHKYILWVSFFNNENCDYNIFFFFCLFFDDFMFKYLIYGNINILECGLD